METKHNKNNGKSLPKPSPEIEAEIKDNMSELDGLEAEIMDNIGSMKEITFVGAYKTCIIYNVKYDKVYFDDN